MELDEFLNAKDGLMNSNIDSNSSFQFDASNDRGVVGNAQLRNASISNAKIGTAVIGTANIGTLSFNEISGGTIGVTAALGGTNISLDGGSKRIVVNDGTVNRIYIGSI